jgi:hypothetical protein
MGQRGHRYQRHRLRKLQCTVQKAQPEGAAAQTLVRCAGVNICQTTGSRIEVETWSKEGRPCRPPMHSAVQGRQPQHTQSLGADDRWRCTLQARQNGTRRRCFAEVNHVAASCQRRIRYGCSRRCRGDVRGRRRWCLRDRCCAAHHASKCCSGRCEVVSRDRAGCRV